MHLQSSALSEASREVRWALQRVQETILPSDQLLGAHLVQASDPSSLPYKPGPHIH